ncbi:MAG: zinc ribbon domain-containing protein [Peptococcaceae bacterium]|nr:zinc ribbon domain-containing protein [Peptococcaceae bacterium]
MDFFQKMVDKAKGLGGMAREVTRKSGELLEVTKLKFEMSKLEKETENNLAGLGAVVYQKYKGATDMDNEIERLCQSTARLEEEMKVIQDQIEKLQPKPLTCPECKVDLPSGGKFCTYCGTKVARED